MWKNPVNFRRLFVTNILNILSLLVLLEAFVNSQLKPVYMVIRHKTSSSVIEFPLIKSSNVNKKNILAMKLKQKSNKNASTIEAEINIMNVYIVS